MIVIVCARIISLACKQCMEFGECNYHQLAIYNESQSLSLHINWLVCSRNTPSAVQKKVKLLVIAGG